MFFGNKTCKTILFHLLVQCLLLLLHVESWAVSSIIEQVIGSGRWGEVEEIEGRKPSWFTGKTHHTLSAIKSSHALRSVQELASSRPDICFFWSANWPKNQFTPRTLEKKPWHICLKWTNCLTWMSRKIPCCSYDEWRKNYKIKSQKKACQFDRRAF